MSRLNQRPTAQETLRLQVKTLRTMAKIDSWNAFVQELQVPADIFPALMTMRPELIKVVEARQLTVEEHQIYLQLIAGLIETNAALRQHAEYVSKMTKNWVNQIGGMVSIAQNIDHYASFRGLEEAKDKNEDDEA